MDCKIIGYSFDYNDQKWYPFFERTKGSIATRAFIICSECKTPISAVGGPMNSAVCVSCWNNKKLFNFFEGKKND
jgi:hypothetical protein